MNRQQKQLDKAAKTLYDAQKGIAIAHSAKTKELARISTKRAARHFSGRCEASGVPVPEHAKRWL